MFTTDMKQDYSKLQCYLRFSRKDFTGVNASSTNKNDDNMRVYFQLIACYYQLTACQVVCLCSLNAPQHLLPVLSAVTHSHVSTLKKLLKNRFLELMANYTKNIHLIGGALKCVIVPLIQSFCLSDLNIYNGKNKNRLIYYYTTH